MLLTSCYDMTITWKSGVYFLHYFLYSELSFFSVCSGYAINSLGVVWPRQCSTIRIKCPVILVLWETLSRFAILSHVITWKSLLDMGAQKNQFKLIKYAWCLRNHNHYAFFVILEIYYFHMTCTRICNHYHIHSNMPFYMFIAYKGYIKSANSGLLSKISPAYLCIF